MYFSDSLVEDTATLADAPPARVAALDFARLPSFTATIARQHRLAVDDRLRALLLHEFGIHGWTVGTRDAIDPARAAVVRLRRGSVGATVRIDLSQHTELASVIEAGTSLQEDFRNAVAAILLAPLVCALQTLGIEGVEVVSVGRAPITPPPQSCCAITFRIGTRRIDVTLEEVDGGWLEMLERVVDQQYTPFAPHVSNLAVPGRLEIGSRTISISVLETLRPGDVVLRSVSEEVDALITNQRPSARVTAVWGHHGALRLRATAEINNHTLTLTNDPIMSHDTDFNAPHPALADSIDAPLEISHLELPLKLEIDAVSLAVAQLSALRTGYVIELPIAVPDARIRLVTYGQTIGFGELVTVGDRLGVRLTQLSQNHGSV
jgi:type III secretion protein Q